MNSGNVTLPDNASPEARDAFNKLKENALDGAWFANVAKTPDEMKLGIENAMGTDEFMNQAWLKANSKFKGKFGTFKTAKFDNGGSHTTFKASKGYLAYLKETYGATNWYAWNLENYGTKWDVNAEVDEFGDDTFHFSFDSAWGAPVEFFDKYLMPLRLKFELRYNEPGCRFAGYVTYAPHPTDPTMDHVEHEHFEDDDYIIYILDEDMESIEYAIPEIEDYDNYDDFAANVSYGEAVLARARNHYNPAPPPPPRKKVAKKVAKKAAARK
jgi:hypothetical protein